MTKIEITEDMIARFCKHIGGVLIVETPGTGRHERLTTLHGPEIRAALDAALNPPPEPEIEVTMNMVDAGYEAFLNWNDDKSPRRGAMTAAIFRAMERERRKSQP